MLARTLTRPQLLVLGFFFCAWLAVVAILVFSPDVYAQTLRLAPGDLRTIEAMFLAGLSALIVLLAAGTVRCWRWTFWLVLIAFLFGILRVPASILQLIGLMPATGPAWYETLQGAIGVVQFVIALAMLAGYRKGGAWADF
jgi:hypothetical protein